MLEARCCACSGRSMDSAFKVDFDLLALPRVRFNAYKTRPMTSAVRLLLVENV
jgi:hypothetical protein